VATHSQAGRLIIKSSNYVDKPDGHIYHEIIRSGDDDFQTFRFYSKPDMLKLTQRVA
jgi:hypothetical protein